MKIKVVAGLSCSGKTEAIKILENRGYYVVDNLPFDMLNDFILFCREKSDKFSNFAVSLDLVTRETILKIDELMEIKNKNDVEIIFIEASPNTIVKRLKELRRPLLLAQSMDTLESIKLEKNKLKVFRENADYVVDTTKLSVNEFRNSLNDILNEDFKSKKTSILIKSFGFKNGVPIDADIIFDTRFLPNPFYVEDLKRKTGYDKEVRDYVMSFDSSKEYFYKILDIIRFILPEYSKEGRAQFILAIGCTGGKHRSVTFSVLLKDELKKLGFDVELYNRDIDS